jgi:hypothetical protein
LLTQIGPEYILVVDAIQNDKDPVKSKHFWTSRRSCLVQWLMKRARMGHPWRTLCTPFNCI